MSLNRTVEVIAGDTIRLTWVSSGASPSPIVSTLFSGSETLVSSVAGVSSGNGHFYAHHNLPNTAAWYANKWFAFVSPDTYVKYQYVKAIKPEVD